MRENVRDERRLQLSAAQHDEEILVDQITKLDDRLADLRRHALAARQPGMINVDQLLDAGRYEHVLQTQRQAAEVQRQAVQLEVERLRRSLLEADREVKTLEKLQEQQAMKHQQLENRREIKELDAAAIQVAASGKEESSISPLH